MTEDTKPGDGTSSPPRINESFVVYQATVTMAAIFLGFVFAGLLALLTTNEPHDALRGIATHLLASSLVLLWSGLMALHITTHKVVKYFHYGLPTGVSTRFGSIAFAVGQVLMFWSLAALAYNKQYLALAVALLLFPLIGNAVYLLRIRRIHANGSHVVNVDKPADPAR